MLLIKARLGHIFGSSLWWQLLRNHGAESSGNSSRYRLSNGRIDYCNMVGERWGGLLLMLQLCLSGMLLLQVHSLANCFTAAKAPQICGLDPVVSCRNLHLGAQLSKLLLVSPASASLFRIMLDS